MRPDTPILLVDHAGYMDKFTNESRKESFTWVNQLQLEAYYQLRKEGYEGLYYLTAEEIGLSLDGTVDGTHPNDLGMQEYAEAYTTRLRSILKEPTGDFTTMIILANSIIHFWGGIPPTKLVTEEETWETIFTPKGIRNYAYGWDRIENVLWRVYHGELDGFEAERILVIIGTNNLHLNTDDEILDGLHLLIEAIKDRQPESEIVLMGILPRRNYEDRIANLNLQISRLAANLRVAFGDVGAVFLDEEHKIRESLFSDGLHPNEAGYLKMREALKPFLGIK
jgi:lysophospholipase L1-like esterase